MEMRLGRFLSFLERRIGEARVISLPTEGKTYPLVYYQHQAKEGAYRTSEEELRRLFPEIDFYGRREDIKL